MHDSDEGVYTLVLDPGFGKTGPMAVYAFNNVMWNNAWGIPISAYPDCSGSSCTPGQMSVYAWNNTVIATSGHACVRLVNRGGATSALLISATCTASPTPAT